MRYESDWVERGGEDTQGLSMQALAPSMFPPEPHGWCLETGLGGLGGVAGGLEGRGERITL